MYAVQCGEYEIYKKQHPETTHYDNDRFNKQIPAIKYVNFEYCNFPMEIDDDINNSKEEFETYNGNKISRNFCGVHTYIKNHCEGAAAFGSVGEYVNNIRENRHLNNIKKTDYNNR